VSIAVAEQLVPTPTRVEVGVQLTTIVVGSWALAIAGMTRHAVSTTPGASQDRTALPSPLGTCGG
jgi:hypothetical protein